MPNIKTLLLPLSLAVIVFLFYLFYLLQISSAKDRSMDRLEHAHTLANHLLEQKKQSALSLSILLANDRQLLESYRRGNRKAAFDLLQNKLDNISSGQNVKYEVQIHDKKMRTYLRSWDYNITGVKLSAFRKGVVRVHDTHKPVTSIELGKRLNIKAIAPMFTAGEYIGSVEVITGFENITRVFNQRRIGFFVLLHRSFAPTAINLPNPHKVGEYLIANKLPLPLHVNRLQNLTLPDKSLRGYGQKGNLMYGYFALTDISGRQLGYIINTITLDPFGFRL